MSRHINRHAKCADGTNCKGPGCKVRRDAPKIYRTALADLEDITVPDGLTFLRSRGIVS